VERQIRARFNTQIYDEACEWFIECRAGDLGDASRGEFDRWLRKSPEHLGAYLEIAAIWNAGPSLDSSNKWNPDTLVFQAAEDPGNIAALIRVPRSEPTSNDTVGVEAHQPYSRERPPASPRRWRVFAPAVSVVALALVAAVWFVLLRFPVYQTGTGEQRSLMLADGSTVELDTRSKIQVRYSENERTIELLEGQALFHVAKDVARPFVVRSDEMRARAVGTQFDVYKKSGGTVVTVVEGRVDVLNGRDGPAPGATNSATDAQRSSLPSDAATSPGSIILATGEQAIVTPETVRKSEHPNLAGATAWTRRQIVFDSASLSEVAEEFNRYNQRKLIVDRSALGNIHISGVFSSTDPASLIRFLRLRPGARIIETPAQIRVEKEIPQRR
jgi:transmembrane sensor